MRNVSEGAEPVAIVGMACRFPGAGDPQAFWRLLIEGRDPITEAPPDRWDADALYDPDPATPGKMVTRWGGFLPEVDRFDASFFGLSPREANHVDPQQRMMLEVAWEALEDAGIPPFELGGSATGVYIAVLTTDYAIDLFTDYADRIDAYSGTGTTRSLVSARIAYFLDLRGPNLTVDTACSGSLTAIHLACESLRRGHCTMALAGGVNLLLRPDGNLFFSKAGALAPDGRCKPFDSRANGIVRSDGIGLLVLKPLSRAVADGDRIHALVLGAAINQDGRSAGVMAPNGEAQQALLRSAYRDAGVEPAQVQYIEAHGTGTIVGDPIEARALGAVLQPGRATGRLCVLGSVKSNIGHTESAAGMAGVIKVALAMQRRTLPGTLHLRSPNESIPFDELGLQARPEAGPWPAPEAPLIAGVSGFGIGGCNAHVVLGEAPPAPPPEQRPRPERSQVLVLSARHPESLRRLAAAYRELLAGEDPAFDALCQGAALQRSHLEHRLALAAASASEAREGLDAFLAGEAWPALAAARVPLDHRPRLAMVLSGQGTHWPGMGRRLAASEPVFAEVLRRCDEVLGELAGWSLLAELAAGEDASRLADTAVAQPAIFAVQAGLVALWRSWGVVPDVVVGQSLGEVAAAHAAGALDLADALRVVYHRSRLMSRVAGQGATALVSLPAEQTRLVLTGYDGRLAVAGNTSPDATVVSGDREAVERLVAALGEAGIFARALRGVDVAFHSPQMDPLAGELEAALAGLEPRAAGVPLVSTVTAEAVRGEELDGGYWARNLRQPFRFAQAMARLAGDGYDAYLEVGPDAVLGGAVRQVLQHRGAEALVLPSMRRQEGEGEAAAIYPALAALHAQGHRVDWKGFYPAPAPRVSLPAYPWHRQRFWLDQLRDGAKPAAGRAAAARGAGGHPLLGVHVESAYPAGQHLWERDLALSSLHWLDEHRIHGAAIFPGVAHLEMARRAGEEVFGGAPVDIEDVVFASPLVLPEDGGAVRVQFVLEGGGDDTARFQLFTRPAADATGPWTRHSSGRLVRREPGERRRVDLEAVRRRCPDPVEMRTFYGELEEDHGFRYGASFRRVSRLQWRPLEATAYVDPPPGTGAKDGFWVHPGLFDSALQTIAQALKGTPTVLPSEAARVRIHERVERGAWCHAVVTDDGPAADGSRLADIFVCDDDGRVLVEVEGLVLRRLNRRRGAGNLLHRLRWEPREAEPARVLEGRGWWLVLGDDSGVADALEALLAAAGEECVRAGRGERFAAEGRRITLDAGAPEDYRRLLREAAEAVPGICRGIVHLWSLDAPADDDLSPAALDAALAAGTSPLLWTLQALVEADAAPRLWVATRGAQAVAAEERVAVAQAPVWGLARVAQREHPELWGGLVDLDPGADPELAAAALWDEIAAGAAEPGVAFRAGRRYALRLEAGGASAGGGQTPRFRPDASYLVTGGLGALGLVAARWMAEHGARRLLLAGRTALPPRESWRDLAADDPAAPRVEAVRELEALGASVQPVVLDVADPQALAAFLDAHRRQGRPPIRGVVHTAGVLSDQILARMTPRDLETVWRPKIHGSWLLHQAFRDAGLDFFVLYSSVASVLGTFGQGNYAAANAFLDALAQDRRAAGLPGLSLNWGPWAEVGMAARTDPASMLAQTGIQMLEPGEAMEGLERALAGREAQVLVARVDWAAWAAAGHPAAARLVAGLVEDEPAAERGAEGAAGRGTYSEAILALADPTARRDRIQELLLELCAAVMRIDPAQLDPRLPFPALGFDSILTAEVRTQIRTHFGVEVPLAGMLLGANLVRVTELVLGALDDGHPVILEPAAEVESHPRPLTVH